MRDFLLAALEPVCLAINPGRLDGISMACMGPRRRPRMAGMRRRIWAKRTCVRRVRNPSHYRSHTVRNRYCAARETYRNMHWGVSSND